MGPLETFCFLVVRRLVADLPICCDCSVSFVFFLAPLPYHSYQNFTILRLRSAHGSLEGFLKGRERGRENLSFVT